MRLNNRIEIIVNVRMNSAIHRNQAFHELATCSCFLARGWGGDGMGWREVRVFRIRRLCRVSDLSTKLSINSIYHNKTSVCYPLRFDVSGNVHNYLLGFSCSGVRAFDSHSFLSADAMNASNSI